MRSSILIVSLLLLTASTLQAAWGLKGETTYEPPVERASIAGQNERAITAPFDEAWRAAIAHLSGASFALDQVLKESRLITLSFSITDPRSAIDCGTIKSWVRNARGRRDYSFEAASPLERYELVAAGSLYSQERKFRLTGKMNILFVDEGASTRVRVMARYITQKEIERRAPLDITPREFIGPSTFSFTTGERGRDAGMLVCVSTMVLERGVLDGIQSQLRAQ